MDNNIVYGIGLILNVLVLCYCCKKWKTIRNIKFLVATQAALSSLTICINSGLYWLPKGKFACFQLPSLVIFFLCLSISNLTCLVCVKYAEMTDTWHLRRSTAMLIFLAVFVGSTLMSSPIFYSIDRGWSIIRLDECMVNGTSLDDAESAKKVHINVVRYVFWFLILQFIIPASIIGSRVVLILIHLWQEESTTDDDTSPKPNNNVAIRFTVTAIFTISFVVVTVFLSLHLDDMDSDEALAFLNGVFHKFILFFVVVFCFPWYLVEMIYSCANNEDSCLVPEYTKQLDI